MKKIFTLFITVALFAMNMYADDTQLSVVANDGWSGTTTNPDSQMGGTITITFSDQWGEYYLCSPASIDLTQYTGYKITYSDPTDAQLKIKYSDGSDDQYIEFDSSATELSGDFSTTTGTVSYFDAQGKESGGSVTISSVVLIDNAGNEVQASYGGKFWGCSVTGEQTVPGSTPITVNYGSGWGQVEIVDTDGNPETFTYGQGDVYVYTIEFGEAIPTTLCVSPQGANGDITWFNAYEGDTSLTFTIDDTAVSEDVTHIYIKCEAGNSTAVINSITRSGVTTGISAVEVEDAADNAPIYNLQGQRVTKDTKGILIQNGKKFVNK